MFLSHWVHVHWTTLVLRIECNTYIYMKMHTHTNTHTEISLTILTLTMAAPFAYATISSTPNSMPHRKGNIIILIELESNGNACSKWTQPANCEMKLNFIIINTSFSIIFIVHIDFFYYWCPLSSSQSQGVITEATFMEWAHKCQKKKYIRNYRNYARSWFRFWFRRWCNHVNWQFFKHQVKKLIGLYVSCVVYYRKM